jgi:hypothetical protein
MYQHIPEGEPMDFPVFIQQLDELADILKERRQKGLSSLVCEDDLRFCLCAATDKGDEGKFVGDILRLFAQFGGGRGSVLHEDTGSLRRLWSHIVAMKGNADYGTPLYLKLASLEDWLRRKEAHMTEHLSLVPA